MTVKSQQKFFPKLLAKQQYSGTVATLLYNWPIFIGAIFFSLVMILVGILLPTGWQTLLLGSGVAVLLLCLIIPLTAFLVYDWGSQREYDRLAKLADMAQANVLVDITCGKLRGSRGMLPHFLGGHYFLIDIYDADKMPDKALARARQLEPPLSAGRRIYKRTATNNRIPLPHNWADIIYCSFSLHEIERATDRQAIFDEFARMLKPNGQLLIAEHGRDWRNFIAFGPGSYSFYSMGTWQKHIQQAGLTIQHHEKWRGLVNLWVVGRQ